MPKQIPTIGDPNWGTPLNAHLAQLQNPTNGGINSFEQFSGRPSTLALDDVGKTYIYTQTGNLHQWTGTTWKVLNESLINVKDYGAVGDGIVDDTLAIQSCFDLLDNAFPDWFASSSINGVSTIFFPRGLFKISSTLNLPKGITVLGANARNNGASQLFQSNSNENIFDLYGKEFLDGNGTKRREADQRIEHLFFRSKGGGIIANPLKYPNTQGFSMGSCYINNCYFLNVDGNYCIDVEGIEQVSNNTFDYCEGGGLKCASGRITNNVFFSQSKAGIVIDSSKTLLTNSQLDLTLITSNTFFGNGSATNMFPLSSSIAIIGDKIVYNINISSNSFVALIDGSGTFGVGSIVEMKNCKISNNIFSQLKGEGIRVNEASFCSFENNNFNSIGNTPSATYILNIADSASNLITNNTFSNCGGLSNIYVNGDKNILSNNLQDIHRITLIGNNNVNKNNFPTETIYPNTLSAGWLNINNDNKFGYSLDNGNVSLSGTIKSGNFNQLLFTLPLGFRPENGKNYNFVTSAGNSGETATVSINYLGDIYITQTSPLGKNDSISFEGIRFKV